MVNLKEIVPLDNLYKFMAIFGLALSITAVVLLAKEGSEFVSRSARLHSGNLELDRAIERARANTESLKAAHRKDNEEFNRLLAAQTQPGTPVADDQLLQFLITRQLGGAHTRPMPKLSDEQLHLFVRRQESKGDDTLAEIKQLEAEASRLQSMQQDLARSKVEHDILEAARRMNGNFLMAIFGVGMATSYIGFYFWYTRLQKPMDAALKSRLKRLSERRTNTIKFTMVRTFDAYTLYLPERTEALPTPQSQDSKTNSGR